MSGMTKSGPLSQHDDDGSTLVENPIQDPTGFSRILSYRILQDPTRLLNGNNPTGSYQAPKWQSLESHTLTYKPQCKVKQYSCIGVCITLVEILPRILIRS